MFRGETEQQVARLESIVLERTGTPDSNSFITVMRKERDIMKYYKMHRNATMGASCDSMHHQQVLL